MVAATAEQVIEESATVEQMGYVFSMNDRCDAVRGVQQEGGKGVSVPEQAYYRATKDDMELFFCAHHFGKHEDRLMTGGWKVECDQLALDKLGQNHYIYSEPE